jgi:RNA polymerase sigma-70 factor (ECF subfamily)
VNSLTDLSDEDLVRLCQETLPDDVRAFAALVERYRQQVFAIAYRVLGDAQEADDQAQEVFIKVYRSIKRFRGDAAFSTWLYRITTNGCLDVLARRKRRLARIDLDVAEMEETRLTRIDQRGERSPEQSALRNELIECIKDSMMALRDRERLVLTLRDVEGLEYQTIADVLSIGMSAVKMRIHRARLAFRQVFARMCRDFLPVQQPN